MDVKKCDRCGAIYDIDFGKNDRGCNFVLITDQAITQMASQRKISFMLEGSPVKIMDICPGCAEDFKRWFERMGKRVTEV